MSENLIEIYDKDYVKNYHRKPGQRYKNIFQHVHLSDNDRILDVGCGNGLLYEYIKNKSPNYKGIDFSESFIKTCKEKFSEIEDDFICADIIEFAKPNENAFTKAFMLDFTEHVYNNELLPIIKSIHKTLSPKGQLFIHTPNGDYFMEILKDKGILKQTIGHVAIRNSKQYNKLFRDAGFNNIEIIKIPHYNILKKLHFLSKTPLIGKFFEARILLIATK